MTAAVAAAAAAAAGEDVTEREKRELEEHAESMFAESNTVRSTTMTTCVYWDVS